MCSHSKLKRRMKFLNFNMYFLMLDIKKCGLTFPIKFILEVGKILTELGFQNYYDEHEKTIVSDDDKFFKLNKGFCLGWANELPTLMYIAIKRISLRELNIGAYSLFFNDDAVLAARSLENCELIKDVMFYNFTLAGVLMNTKKPMISKGNVFCEIYTRTEEHDYDGRKRQALTSLGAKILTSNSFTEVRECMKAIIEYSDQTTHDIELIYQARICEKWGNIFSDLPLSCGGFYATKQNYLDTGFTYLENYGSREQIFFCMKYLNRFKRFKEPIVLDLRSCKTRIINGKKINLPKRFTPDMIKELHHLGVTDDIKDKIYDMVERGVALISETTFYLAGRKKERIAELAERLTNFGMSFRNAISSGISPEEFVKMGIG